MVAETAREPKRPVTGRANRSSPLHWFDLKELDDPLQLSQRLFRGYG